MMGVGVWGTYLHGLPLVWYTQGFLQNDAQLLVVVRMNDPVDAPVHEVDVMKAKVTRHVVCSVEDCSIHRDDEEEPVECLKKGENITNGKLPFNFIIISNTCIAWISKRFK